MLVSEERILGYSTERINLYCGKVKGEQSWKRNCWRRLKGVMCARAALFRNMELWHYRYTELTRRRYDLKIIVRRSGFLNALQKGWKKACIILHRNMVFRVSKWSFWMEAGTSLIRTKGISCLLRCSHCSRCFRRKTKCRKKSELR